MSQPQSRSELFESFLLFDGFGHSENRQSYTLGFICQCNNSQVDENWGSKLNLKLKIKITFEKMKDLLINLASACLFIFCLFVV